MIIPRFYLIILLIFDAKSLKNGARLTINGYQKQRYPF